MYCVENYERKQKFPYLFFLFSIIFILSACGSGGGGAKHQVTDDCHRVAAKQDAQGNPAEANSEENKQDKASAQKGVCGPKGFIEIAENYSTNDEVKQEFDQAVALLKQENYKEAIKLLKSVTGKATKFSGPHINLGIAYTRIGDWKNAEQSLKHAIKLNKTHPVANNELGLVYRKTGRYKEARKSYENLLERYPDFLPARKNLGVLCDIYIQDLQCALDQYESYLKANPDDKKVKIWVADVKKRMK